MKRLYFIIIVMSLSVVAVKAQFPYGTTGLLHAPTAEMQADKTLMIGTSFLNREATPTPAVESANDYRWPYHTFNYYFDLTLFPFLEISYDLTPFRRKAYDNRFVGQDRNFSVRLRLLKERKYLPALLVGSNDVLTNFSTPDSSGNGSWNRYYVAASKHFSLCGELGVHVGYVYNQRRDYPLNGPTIGLKWNPIFHQPLNVIMEYDARTPNIGFEYSLWNEHLNVVFELNNFRYPSAGIYYKVALR